VDESGTHVPAANNHERRSSCRTFSLLHHAKATENC